MIAMQDEVVPFRRGIDARAVALLCRAWWFIVWLPVALTLPCVAFETQVFSPVELVSPTAELKGVVSWTIEGRRHRGGIRTIAYSPNGNWLATGGADGTVRIWTRRQAPVAILTGHLNVVLCVAWSPDGNRLASSDAAGMIRVWDPQTGKCLLDKSVEPHQVRQLAWSPDSRQLAAAHEDACLRVWDSQSGSLSWTADELGSAVESVAWSPNGKLLAAGVGAGEVIIFDSTSHLRKKTCQGSAGDVHSLAWSPDSRTLASLSGIAEESVRLWDVATGDLRRQIPQAVGRMAWSSNGNLLATANSQRFRLWDVNSGMLVRESPTPRNVGVDCLAWSPDSLELAAGDNQGAMWLWNAKAPVPVGSGPARNVFLDVSSNLAFSRDGTRLAFGLPDHVAVWDLRSCQCRPSLPVGGMECVQWHPGGRILAAGGYDDVLHLWDSQTGQKIREIRSGYEDIKDIAWCPDGRRILVRDGKHRVWIEDVSQGRTLLTLSNPPENWSGFSAWAPDGNRLATSGMAHIWDLHTGRRIRDCGRFFSVLAWSPDGLRLAGAEGPMVGLIPMTGDTETFDFTTTLTFTATLAWLDGGKRLAGACWEKVVYWELPTRKMIREVSLEPPIRHIALYQISPDARYVAAARRPDGTIRLYDADSGQLVRVFAQWMDRNYAVFTPEGHYLATPGAEQELLYATVTEQGARLFTADEFARKYRWKNSPQKVALRPSRPARGGREP